MASSAQEGKARADPAEISAAWSSDDEPEAEEGMAEGESEELCYSLYQVACTLGALLRARRAAAPKLEAFLLGASGSYRSLSLELVPALPSSCRGTPPLVCATDRLLAIAPHDPDSHTRVYVRQEEVPALYAGRSREHELVEVPLWLEREQLADSASSLEQLAAGLARALGSSRASAALAALGQPAVSAEEDAGLLPALRYLRFKLGRDPAATLSPACADLPAAPLPAPSLYALGCLLCQAQAAAASGSARAAGLPASC